MTDSRPKKNHLLLVEDEQILADIIKQKLEQHGFIVDLATDGDEGLQKILANRPDMVLLDVLLPKKNGYQVLEYLRTHADTKDLPVLVISNSGQPVEIDRILELGVCDYLIKAEFTPQDVIDKVEKCLGGSGVTRAKMFTPQKHKVDIGSIDTMPERGVGGGRKKVLLVEDDKMLADLAYMQLFRDGYMVEMVIDGEGVLPKLKTFTPDIILLDIRLPDMDGFQVLAAVRGVPAYKNIPVIIVSNFDQEDYRKKAKELGAVEYLVKADLDTHAISDKVKAIIG
ncbi:MAG: hypothetical protein A3F54_04520 [Candidatus Kerfeldbacteria bacterium RIFCSPHIGHO2_12_FULL_48_17]|uniref:Response regulatory domain-containing protein n=1 Tax=Candidatus Kerfeldbacteria bacterium RIFCSPHIGHO2_12_FULL_48_17 TaxID=1798542 RepID=A0A1G2B1J4_9BACT|nr:MAG: hypothetical protein A3F54_04520 [Candidatus Kerfeldbacteria bacterium RIFCSPHIGHO2_12_FULL_48_17]